MHEIWLLKPRVNPLEEDNPVFNFYGDYTYMREGYYETLQSQLSGVNIHPTSQESLDAYIVAIAMEKAQRAGIPVPEFRIATERTKIDSFPVIGYAMNPFSNNSYIINDAKFYEHKIKSLTLSGKYLALVQKIPDGNYRLDTLRCIMGRVSLPEYADFAMKVFRTFRLPLMRIKTLVTLDRHYLSAIEPLDYDALTINEKKMVDGMGEWQK